MSWGPVWRVVLTTEEIYPSHDVPGDILSATPLPIPTHTLDTKISFDDYPKSMNPRL